MAPSLVDTSSETVAVGGSTVATITLPTHGARDLVVVAVGWVNAEPVRRVGRPGDVRFPIAAEGWQTVCDTPALAVLARFGTSTLDLPAYATTLDAGAADVAAASFTGVTEHRDDRTITIDDPAYLPGVTGPGVTLAFDGLAVSAIGGDSPLFGPTTPTGWTAGVTSPVGYAELIYSAESAGAVAGPVWAFTVTEGMVVTTCTLGVGDDTTPVLPALPSSSRAGFVSSLAPALGDPPAEFTELTYRSDGIPPDPLPVVTPADPWADTP